MEGLNDLLILDTSSLCILLYPKIRKLDSKAEICFLTASKYYHEQFRKEQKFDEIDQEPFQENQSQLRN